MKAMRPAPQAAAIAALPLRLLLAAFAAGCLLHADHMPPWCTAVALGALLWTHLAARGRIAMPAAPLRIGITVLLVLAVIVSFRTVNGLAAGTALLVAMGSAKLLELRGVRDAVVVATVALVLVMAAALDRQQLWRLPPYVGAAWLALASVAALGSVEAARSARRAFTASAWTALLAIPLAALCFVLVPRLPGPLWSMPGNERAQTGLSEEMSPGSISDLAISEDIAFRVRFEGEVPPPEQRYWRGPVLHDFDGSTWRRQQGNRGPIERREMLSPPLRYHVVLQPHGRNYLFALDTLEEIEGIGYQRLSDGETLAWRPIGSVRAYDAVSHLQWRNIDALPGQARRIDTRLPPGRNPRSVQLAARLRAGAASDLDYATQVMAYFRDGGIEYSLTPPRLDRDSIDELLFDTRLGYCGHFASAFVVLMRAAGIPARVVTGYLGGTLNRIDGHYTVRQSDAHAWAEVWLEGRGWTRFDPTAMVAPERLQRAATDVLAARRQVAEPLLGQAGWLRGIRDAWDAAGGWWQDSVVNFNRAKQRDLLRGLGLGDLRDGALALLLVAGGLVWALLLYTLLSRRPAGTPRDALARTWDRFARLLRRRGVAIADSDGPDAIRRRAQRLLPSAAEDIGGFMRDYTRLRFGRAAAVDAEDLARLRIRLSAIARATAARRRR